MTILADLGAWGAGTPRAPSVRRGGRARVCARPAAILDELADRDGQTLFEICGRLATRHQLSMSRQAISQHLDLLEGAGLVRTRREGRYKFHDLQTDALESLVDRWVKRPRKEKR